jgi:hypothetical protein
MALITTNGLRAKWLGKDIWLSDPGVRCGGRLLARITRKGAFFYFQYFSADGRRRPFPLGPFDIQGEQGLVSTQSGPTRFPVSCCSKPRAPEVNGLEHQLTIDTQYPVHSRAAIPPRL